MFQVHRAPGDDDDRDLAGVGVCGDLLLDGEATERGQTDIQHHQIRTTVVDPSQCVEAVSGFVYLEPGKRQRGSV